MHREKLRVPGVHMNMKLLTQTWRVRERVACEPCLKGGLDLGKWREWSGMEGSGS